MAVLEKVKSLPWENDVCTLSKNVPNSDDNEKKNEEPSLEEEAARDETLSGNGKRILEGERKPQRKRRRVAGYREDPFVFFKDETEDVWQSIKWVPLFFFAFFVLPLDTVIVTFLILLDIFTFRDFYGISDNLDPRCLLVRCHEGKKKNIYFTSPAIRDLVISNEDKVKMINTGVKTFVRCDNKSMKCAFRLAQEGMQSIIHYVSDGRKVHVSKEDLIMLLQNDDPHMPPEIVKLSPATQERLKEFGKYKHNKKRLLSLFAFYFYIIHKYFTFEKYI